MHLNVCELKKTNIYVLYVLGSLLSEIAVSLTLSKNFVWSLCDSRARFYPGEMPGSLKILQNFYEMPL